MVNDQSAEETNNFLQQKLADYIDDTRSILTVTAFSKFSGLSYSAVRKRPWIKRKLKSTKADREKAFAAKRVMSPKGAPLKISESDMAIKDLLEQNTILYNELIGYQGALRSCHKELEFMKEKIASKNIEIKELRLKSKSNVVSLHS